MFATDSERSHFSRLLATDFGRPSKAYPSQYLFPNSPEKMSHEQIVWHAEFFHHYWWTAIPISLLYVWAIYTGKSIMQNRSPMALRTPLILWNAGLALFSWWGAIQVVPALLNDIRAMSLRETICFSCYGSCQITASWVYLFAYSKLVELGDTAFIVLRKSPLIFLHWYHHVTVLWFTWYATGVMAPVGIYFIAMNLVIHSLMYSYYTLRAAKISVPRVFQMTLTLLQIVQMLVGSVVNFLAFQYKLEIGEACRTTFAGQLVCWAMYGSYTVLFSLFFYKTYIKRQRKDDALSPEALIRGLSNGFRTAFKMAQEYNDTATARFPTPAVAAAGVKQD